MSKKAVEAASTEIFDAIGGIDAERQIQIDNIAEVELDGAPVSRTSRAARRQRHSRRSLAVAKAAAEAAGLPLYRYVGGASAHLHRSR